eukprot:g4493.t1
MAEAATGFDLQRQAEAMDILNSMCEALVARGYCLLQRPPQPARAEEARENAEKLQELYHLNSLAELLANSPSAFGSRAVYSQTGTILRVPHMAEGVSLVGRAGAMDERDKLMAEEFMMWVVARRLCLFYKVEVCEDLYWAPDRDAPLRGLAYIIHGSFVEEDQLIGFDNDFFGIDIEEAQALAPSQRWVMEVGYEVLWKAGWTKPTLRGQRIGSFLGDSGSEWNFIYLKRDRYAISNNTGWVTCSRLGHTLGRMVESLHASHMMVRRNTRIGEKIAPLSEDNMKDQAQLKYAVCMGVLVMLHPGGWIGECAATMLSYKGRAFTFDVGADGFIRGEGCCAVHLAAENDGERAAGERSLAVLLGSCANQAVSFQSNAPYPVQVGECHGTGTALGDPIEIGAMKSVQFNKRSNPLLHASAKSNVGHEEANAGTCGFIKVCMLLNGGVSTPNPHLTALNPHLDTNAYPVMFTNELTCTARRSQYQVVQQLGVQHKKGH